MQVLQDIPVLVHNPRDSSSDRQELMPRRYLMSGWEPHGCIEPAARRTTADFFRK